MMKTICTVASDYLGLEEKDCLVSFDTPVSKACLVHYYRGKAPDEDYSIELPKVCGNCMHWVVVE